MTRKKILKIEGHGMIGYIYKYQGKYHSDLFVERFDTIDDCCTNCKKVLQKRKKIIDTLV